MPLEIIESRFGKYPIIVKDGFMFHFKCDGSNKKIWLCSERGNRRCPVRIHTTKCSNNPELLNELGEHTHEPDPAKIDVKRMMKTIKKNATNSIDTPKSIIASNVQSMPFASKANMPPAHILSRMIRKVRAKEKSPSDNPNSCEDIDTSHTETIELKFSSSVNPGNSEDINRLRSPTVKIKEPKSSSVNPNNRKDTNRLHTPTIELMEPVCSSANSTKSEDINTLPPPTIELIESRFGKYPIIVKDGFMFHFKCDGSNKKIWLCSERGNRRCSVRIHTTKCSKNPQFLNELGEHTHEPDPAKIDVKKMMKTLKNNAIYSQETPKNIIASNVQGMSFASKANMPLGHSLSRMIRKVRAKEKSSSVVPNRCEDINLPTLYPQANEVGEFMVYDSGPSTGTT